MDNSTSSVSSIPNQKWLSNSSSSDLSSFLFSLPLSREFELSKSQEESLSPPPPPPCSSALSIESYLNLDNINRSSIQSNSTNNREFSEEKMDDRSYVPSIPAKARLKYQDIIKRSQTSQIPRFTTALNEPSKVKYSRSNCSQAQKRLIAKLRNEPIQAKEEISKLKSKQNMDEEVHKIDTSSPSENIVLKAQHRLDRLKKIAASNKSKQSIHTEICKTCKRSLRGNISGRRTASTVNKTTQSTEIILNNYRNNTKGKTTNDVGLNTSFLKESSSMQQLKLVESLLKDKEYKATQILSLEEKLLEMDHKAHHMQSALNIMQGSKSNNDGTVSGLQMKAIQQQNQIDSLYSENISLKQKTLAFPSINDSTLQRYSSLTNRVLQLESKYQTREDELSNAISMTKRSCMEENDRLRRIHREELEDKDNQLQVFHTKILRLTKKVQLLAELSEKNCSDHTNSEYAAATAISSQEPKALK